MNDSKTRDHADFDRLLAVIQAAKQSYDSWPQWMKDLAYFAGRDDGEPDQ